MLFSVYAKRDDFKFEIVIFPSLEGDCPCSVNNISQLIHFAAVQVCYNIGDSNKQ